MVPFAKTLETKATMSLQSFGSYFYDKNSGCVYLALLRVDTLKILMSTDLVIPLFVAMIKIGAISLSRALFKNEKLSMSNICTSSTKST